MYELPEESILYAEDRRGIYIPQHFAESIRRELVEGVDDEQYSILEQGPEHEQYWDVWDEVLATATIYREDMDGNTIEHFLYQDGDLWVIPKGTPWPNDGDEDGIPAAL